MRVFNLIDFFNITGYNWKKDSYNLNIIAKFTKTRKSNLNTNNYLSAGIEQTFLLKAIAEWVKAETFFEIGTGRGTACYALSLLDTVKDIHTVDILKFNQKFHTAIGYKKAFVSLSDIRDMIPFKQKSKVKFHHRKEFSNIRKMKNYFDICFIDGDHTSKPVIIEDYSVCKDILKQGGLIIWDDYDPNRFAVKEIVDDLLAKDKRLDAILVEQRGHLFPDKPAEKDIGVVIMKEGKIDV